jgi:hypothetical protein
MNEPALQPEPISNAGVPELLELTFALINARRFKG